MTQSLLRLFAPAKINLFLHVTGRRDDGYHLLQSLTVFAKDFADTLEFTASDRFSLTLTGPFAHHVPEENLVTRAAALFDRPPVHVTLTKNIPAGAGLGGGSADAAAAFKGFETLFFGMEEGQRKTALLSLGADVPACYHGAPCIFSGIGDVIGDAPPLPSFALLILWPDCHSATKDVFAARRGPFTPPVSIPDIPSYDALAAFLMTTSNDLQDAAIALNPAIARALESLAGADLTRMSGSGSAVFGLYRNVKEAEDARLKLEARGEPWLAIVAAF